MNRQFMLFLTIGGVQYLLDAGTFSLLILAMAPDIANVISRVIGASAGYALNGFFTFRKQGEKAPINIPGLGRFAIIWVLMTFISTVLIKAGLAFWSDVSWQFTVALKLITELILAVLSFLLQKFFVYDDK